MCVCVCVCVCVYIQGALILVPSIPEASASETRRNVQDMFPGSRSKQQHVIIERLKRDTVMPSWSFLSYIKRLAKTNTIKYTSNTVNANRLYTSSSGTSYIQVIHSHIIIYNIYISLYQQLKLHICKLNPSIFNYCFMHKAIIKNTIFGHLSSVYIL